MGSNMEGNPQLLQQLAAEKPIIAAPGSSSFKRTFPFDVRTGALRVHAPLGFEENLLWQHREKYRGMKMLRALWSERKVGSLIDSAGTYFPVAAPDGEAIWASAGHCLMQHKQLKWSCSYDQQVIKSSPSCQPAFREVVDLNWLTDGVSEGDLDEFKPSESSCPIPRADVMPGFGFMRTTSFELQPKQLFIPCADELQHGKPVCVLGFASKPDTTWGATFLRTEADYDELRLQFQGLHHRDVPANWALDEGVAAQRILDLLDDVCHPNQLVAAPGTVTAATQRIIEHTCSSFPGMSGSPGVDITAPWKLLFVHTRADADFRSNVNYGYSVNHPLFIKAYAREVLPKLLGTPTSVFQPGQLQCLYQYLTTHQELLEDPSALDRVAALM